MESKTPGSGTRQTADGKSNPGSGIRQTADGKSNPGSGIRQTADEESVPGSGRRQTADGRPTAVVLLSGGLDSYTAAAVAKREGFSLSALSINYGQRHVRELVAARAVATAVGVTRHLELAVDLSRIGGSALTSPEIEVPKDRSIEPHDIPSTYVPARNTIFLALALGWAEVLGASDLVIGVNALDYSGYPDCRPEFIRAFEAMARLATRAGVGGRPVTIHTPLIALSKAAIITLGISLGLDYGLTHSCYDPAPDGRPCGRCDSCRLRAAGFAEAGVPDPLVTGAD